MRLHRFAVGLVALLALLVVSSDELEARSGSEPNVRNIPLGLLLDDVALNAAAATRTLTLEVGRHKASGAVCVVDYTRSSGTDVTATFTGSLDGTTYGARQSRAISSGVATLSDLVDTKVGTVSAVWILEYRVAAYETVQILFGGTAVDGSDLVDVTCTLTAE